MKNNKKKEKVSLKQRIKDGYFEFKSHPVDSIKSVSSICKKNIKKHKYFFAFLFINLINEIVLRFFCFETISTLLRIDPVLADLTLLIFIGAIGYLMSEKKRIVFFVIMSLILTILCTVNSAYYTFYTSFASVSFLSTTKFLVSVGDAVVENVLKLRDFFYPTLFVLLIVLYIKYSKGKEHLPKNKHTAFNFFKVGLVVLIAFCATLRGVHISSLVKQWNRNSIVSKYGLYIYHGNDLVKSIEPKLICLFGYDNAVKKFNNYYINYPNENKKNEYTNILKDKKVIAIHAESIQNFLIGLKINGQEVTPNLNKFAQKSMYFTNFYTQVGVGTSSDTEFTLATSLMPSNTGTAFASYFDRKYESFYQELKDKGYYTYAMHGNNADYWNRRIMHKNLGYDYFYAKDDFEIDETIGLGLSDKSFFRQAIEKLKVIDEENKKYYGTFIMLTNHTPFSELDKYGEFDVSKTVNGVKYPYLEGTTLGKYLKSAHYADAALGQFFNDLEKNGLLKNTVIVLYGDHDARLPIDDFRLMYNYDYLNDDVLSEDDPKYKEFNNYDYELNRKVPLMIYSKDLEPKKINSLMGMYDLSPTLGNMLGVHNKYALGRDIFNHLDDNIVVFPAGNWMTNKVYYNAQKDEYITLKKNAVISDKYIEKNAKYADDLLDVSNAIIVFDLIGKDNQKIVDENEVVGNN